ncbi:tRNA(Phe) 7-((3-amino-3-carboxypropyl)-4-demethylwyosine(37)-N(4))-methyltransferase [Archaeoglobus veneficus]|uniref:tRNA(Phe) 7-((3-amino-3-carboxypropyl)-4-demethylwyosine(37)-N(4))-methyltransferase n=1 Tax=Archaeoglobus veneficus (strain DSM 11195 / SNP6) TaxID=693661 RepID=F2KT86_ARCVS|nr:hypothetical protein [Archaeoglobus veneficus]AEA47116.1 tRNA wybutosine-synthesizing protein [Archaeoglobus veneficus SNP6]
MRSWELYRQEKLRRLENAVERSEVDEDITALLTTINEISEYVTLSSCSGRIAVMDMPEFGNKLEAVFLGKWHRCVTVEEVSKAVEKGRLTTWFMVHPPIIHIACRNLRSAGRLMEAANRAGFRRCGLISLRNNVVEIASLERMEVPVAVRGRKLVDSSSLEIMVEIANRKLERAKEKLKRLEEEIKRLNRFQP